MRPLRTQTSGTDHVPLLSGSLGLGHGVLVRSCSQVFKESGWKAPSLDDRELLGRCPGMAAERLFTQMVGAAPGLSDALHFVHLRTVMSW